MEHSAWQLLKLNTRQFLSLHSIDYLSKQIMNFSECQNSCNKTDFQYPSTNSRLYIHTRRIGCNEKTTSPSCKSYTEIAATITPRHVAGNVAQTGHFRMQKGSIKVHTSTSHLPYNMGQLPMSPRVYPLTKAVSHMRHSTTVNEQN